MLHSSLYLFSPLLAMLFTLLAMLFTPLDTFWFYPFRTIMPIYAPVDLWSCYFAPYVSRNPSYPLSYTPCVPEKACPQVQNLCFGLFATIWLGTLVDFWVSVGMFYMARPLV